MRGGWWGWRRRGGYARAVVLVTPGEVKEIIVGKGGAPGDPLSYPGDGGPGGDSLALGVGSSGGQGGSVTCETKYGGGAGGMGFPPPEATSARALSGREGSMGGINGYGVGGTTMFTPFGSFGKGGNGGWDILQPVLYVRQEAGMPGYVLISW